MINWCWIIGFAATDSGKKGRVIMFDMMKVGKTISTLRKEKNMTQMELADKLNISFQAVSNWERGQTMPDISKLGELADIFGVTIDELLGSKKGAQVVENIIRELPVEELTAEEFLEMAPLVRPKQAERLWESVQAEVTLKDLVRAAPFLSESTLDSLARDAVKRDRSFESLMGLLPHLSQDTVDDCVQQVLAEGLNIKKVIMAAPFLSRESIECLADRVLKEGGVMDLVPLAPFLGREKLTEAAAKCVEKYGFSKILPLLPFLDRKLLDEFFLNKWKDKEK
jgi:transcriptional regulator with XRE-family HTH domain